MFRKSGESETYNYNPLRNDYATPYEDSFTAPRIEGHEEYSASA